MSILDIAIIILAILAAFVGFARGFKKMFFGKLTKIVAILTAVIFASRFSAFLSEIVWVEENIVDIFPPFGSYILLIFAGLILMVGIVLIFGIIRLVLSSKKDNPTHIIDRIFGVFFGLFNLAIFILIIFVVTVALSRAIPPIESWLDNFLSLSDDSVSGLSKYIYHFAGSVLDFIATLFTTSDPEEILILTTS